jgi:hypothetical protein
MGCRISYDSIATYIVAHSSRKLFGRSAASRNCAKIGDSATSSGDSPVRSCSNRRCYP